MKKSYWLLLFFSAFLYAIPFLFTDYLWWSIFFFPIPLLYITRKENLSFAQGYVWGLIVFGLHLSGGIYVIASMAHKSWPVGVALGIAMVAYQALSVALLFWCATMIVTFFSLRLVVARLCIWTGALLLFIMWTDWYSLSIFGIKEGYPLMHPLIPLAQHSALLSLLPHVGKLFLTLFFLLFAVTAILMLWYKNAKTLLLFIAVCMPWIFCWYNGESEVHAPGWLSCIKSMPHMICSTVDYPITMIKIVGNELKKIIENYPQTTVIIMPESAFNCTNFSDFPELIDAWSEQFLGRAIHIIFGAFRWRDGNYYNTLHWVYNGVLKECFDKRHAMLISERLVFPINFSAMHRIYFSNTPSVKISCHERVPLHLLDDYSYVPYICSELFFNEYPDDVHTNIPIIVIVNDSLFAPCWSSYMQKLLLLLARCKAIAWQREIVYISYTQSVFIDTSGMITEINE